MPDDDSLFTTLNLLRGYAMSDTLTQLEEQLKAIQSGLFRMGPERIRALSTHETDDLIIKLEKTTTDALNNVAKLKG